MLAAIYGRTDIVRELLSAGTNMNHVDKVSNISIECYSIHRNRSYSKYLHMWQDLGNNNTD